MTVPVTLSCGQCVFAVGDAVLPPVWAWTMLPAGWLVAAAVTRLRGAGVARQAAGAIAIVLLLAIAALLSGVAGPLPFVALAAAPAWWAVRAPAGSPQRRTGGIVLRLAVLLLVASVAIVLVRPRGSWAVRWSEAGPAASWVRGKRRTLEDLRAVVREGRSVAAGAAAVRLANEGDPGADLALLEAARERLGADASSGGLDAAVATMRGRAAAGR